MIAACHSAFRPRNFGSSIRAPVVSTRSARIPWMAICTPSMSTSTEASANSLPECAGVTDSTVILTRLNPTSPDRMPSIALLLARRTDAACAINHNFPIWSGDPGSTKKHSGRETGRVRVLPMISWRSAPAWRSCAASAPM